MTGTERKVFQKYYPPDFDPSKIPKAKGGRNRQFVQRVMAPFNMQCNTCHEYIYKGKKFNMRRETAEGEQYLGLKIFRFYFRCPNCLAEISFKTDIENVDYQMEQGATRLFEAFKYYQEQEKKKEMEEEAEKTDPMKQLEKRTKMSRIEMEAMGKLEELQEANRRAGKLNPLEYLEEVEKRKHQIFADMLKRQEEEDEAEIRRIFGKTEDGKIMRRLEDDDESTDEPGPSSSGSTNGARQPPPTLQGPESTAAAQKRPLHKALNGVIVKKKPKAVPDQTAGQGQSQGPPSEKPFAIPALPFKQRGASSSSSSPAQPSAGSSGSSLLGLADYGSDDSD